MDEQRNDYSAARRFRVWFAKVVTSSVAEWKRSERRHAGKLRLKLSEVGLMPAWLVRSPEDLERELPSACGKSSLGHAGHSFPLTHPISWASLVNRPQFRFTTCNSPSSVRASSAWWPSSS